MQRLQNSSCTACPRADEPTNDFSLMLTRARLRRTFTISYSLIYQTWNVPAKRPLFGIFMVIIPSNRTFSNGFPVIFLLLFWDDMCISPILPIYGHVCSVFSSQIIICKILVCIIRDIFSSFRMIFTFWIFNQLHFPPAQRRKFTKIFRKHFHLAYQKTPCAHTVSSFSVIPSK